MGRLYGHDRFIGKKRREHSVRHAAPQKVVMVDFMRKWLWGIAGAWGSFGLVTAYIYAKGPLPNTDKYIQMKYEKRLPLMERLDELDTKLLETLDKRKQDRERWLDARLKAEEQKAKAKLNE